MRKIAYIDLSTPKVEHIDPGMDLLTNYLGGRGLGVKLVYDNLNPALNPYHPDNVIVFATGPLTATRVYTSGRYALISKSPLTNTIFDSNSGGFFGFFLKSSGFDAVLIKGRAPKPSIIVVDEGDVTVKSADGLWGLPTGETVKELLNEYGSRCGVACIGPAGENLTRFACVVSDGIGFAGRGGLGAVLGSKNVKAVVARGSRRVDVADENLLNDLLKNFIKRIRLNPITGKSLPRFGTPVLVNVVNEYGMFPSFNFKSTYFEDAELVSGEALIEGFIVKSRSCYNCPIACKKVTRVNGRMGEGPEYESLWALSALCGINDLKTVIEANYLCNDLGLDTITMGSTLACAMELSERRLIPIQLSWGDKEKVKNLILDTAYRRGLGNDLAEGSKRLAEKYGYSEASMNVKGLELPAYDPRGAYGQALAYATSNRGGCHLRAYMISFELLGVPVLLDRFSPVGKADLVVYQQNFFAAVDSLVLCKFLTLGLDDESIAQALKAVTGKPYDKRELLKAGERIWNLERSFNLREGFTSSDDTLPTRLLTPVDKGPCAGRVIPLKEMLNDYYAVRGWLSGNPLNGEPLKNPGVNGLKPL